MRSGSGQWDKDTVTTTKCILLSLYVHPSECDLLFAWSTYLTGRMVSPPPPLTQTYFLTKKNLVSLPLRVHTSSCLSLIFLVLELASIP